MDRRQALLAALAAGGAAWAPGLPGVAQTRAAGPSPKVTAPLSAFIAGSQAMPIPEEILDLGRRHILDTLASVVACRDLEPSVLARKYALAQSGDARRSSATILGTHQRAGLVDAVFASAMTAHGAEINDFIPSAFVQPGPSIVSAAVALAEQRKKSGAAVLRAVLTGYELAGRVPKALGNENLRLANIANHGIGPVFGTAAAAASLLGLPEDRISDLLTYCAQQASGSWQWMLDVEHIEKSFVFAGMGARSGLQAALFVEQGFRGVRDSFDNPAGWMNSAIFTGRDANRPYLIEKLGQRWEMHETAYKRYPVGGPTQPAVHGLLQLLPKIDRKSVASVKISMPGRWQAFRDAEMPALNLRYLSAIILIDGRLDFVSAQSLQRMHGDAAAKALMTRVDVVHDPEQEHDPGEARTESARVEVTHTDGRRVEIFVPYVVGFPSHPMSKADVEAKALELMTPRLGAARSKAVVARVWDIDHLADGGRLASLIAA
ncbi:MAG: MmgE/PrpD family protein [Alphaproteobacteria bacterium]|nr:MmgE/PrpD family protein [Alphaproteobacteria bacterium]MBU1516677.1 MmgE/PrpD family protein [Alphaproteobacteria bacterium]MBU2094433.1 MmgE/PrpD family protein [Alphaproteobacteria bacterium]MBU2152660.1 MmgE/PrpD family protein [Alphaproteobacteria bacterium]MBU2306152.1 MmgE/PrpD family protein [Alphaproteobacteria bacterium]